MNHKSLYDKIPDFVCKEGCTDCCGPMQHFDDWELSQLKNKKLPTGFNCPYKTDTGCEVHEQRPLICRLFGNVDGLECPHGFGPQTKLTKKEYLNIMIEYNKEGIES